MEAVRRGVGSTSNSQPSGTSRSAEIEETLPDGDRSATESSETVQPTTTDSTGTQPETTDSQPVMVLVLQHTMIIMVTVNTIQVWMN